MGKRSDYKKHDEIAANDMDKGCRSIVNQATPGRRRLRKRLKRQARARLKGAINESHENYNDSALFMPGMRPEDDSL